MAFVGPVTLQARNVRLLPLALAHEEGLQAAASDGQLWKLRVTSVPEHMKHGPTLKQRFKQTTVLPLQC